VSVQHPGGLRTSYEPVRPAVRAGQRVDTGTALGVLLDGHSGCPVRACLHWGAMWGPASRADYVDPLDLLMSTPIVLKPVDAPDRAPRAAAQP
jgi:murein DD-endopeptidase MepM/ murein hydrolase activator NlpD